jgi:ABC-type nitrate/sulfonate/bicarbonate transport system permease component
MSEVVDIARRGAGSVIVVIGFIAVWQLLVMIFQVPTWLLPAPSAIWLEFVKQSHLLGRHLSATAGGAVGGLGIGSVCGLGLAILMVQSRLLERILMPLLVIDQSVPKMALGS